MESNVRGQDQIDFRLYGKILFKRRWTIATFFIIVVTLVTITTLVQTPIFEASAIIQIEPAPPEVVPFKDVVTVGSQSFWANKEYYQTQFWILRSEPLAQEVADELDLTNSDPVFVGNPNPARSLANMISVQPLKNSQLVRLSVEHPDPDMAQSICNTLAQKYQEQNVELMVKAKMRSNIIDSLNDRESSKEQSLREAENELLSFMEENDIVSFEGRQNIVMQRMTTLSEALTEANRKRVEAQASYQKAHSLQKQGKGLQLPEVTENQLIQQLKEDKILLEKKYSEMSVKYKPEYPEMQKLQKQIELINSKINEEVSNIVGSYRTTFQIALAREQELSKEVDNAKKEVQDLNVKGVEYGVLKRKVDSEAEIFEELIRRSKETQVMQQLRATNITVREFATRPKGHIRPKRKTNIALSALLGLFGGIAIAFLLEYLDNRIKSQQELERATGMPFLGIIPSFSSDEPEIHSELFTHAYPKSSITESIRSIRTNIMFSAHQQGFNKLLVTSAGPQEGKSTTVINLGIIFAQSGRKVLIIDSDLRRPRLHRAFGIGRGVGLTNMIMNEAAAEDAIQHTEVPNLAIVPCGPIPPNPSELLGSARMEEVIADLETRFDIILFDSPPIVAVTDAVVLSQKVDGVVLIAKSNKTTTDMVSKATRQLTDVKANILGTVLNDFNVKGEGYKYYYYYRYYRSEEGESVKKRVRRSKPDAPTGKGESLPESNKSDTNLPSTKN